MPPLINLGGVSCWLTGQFGTSSYGSRSWFPSTGLGSHVLAPRCSHVWFWVTTVLEIDNLQKPLCAFADWQQQKSGAEHHICVLTQLSAEPQNYFCHCRGIWMIKWMQCFKWPTERLAKRLTANLNTGCTSEWTQFSQDYMFPSSATSSGCVYVYNLLCDILIL